MVLLLLVKVGNALHRDVVRLRCAAGEDDLLGVRTNDIGHVLARCLNGILAFPAIQVRPAVGVAKLQRNGTTASGCLRAPMQA